jgi:pimeloyl-ACP methyl ester carboxylesterase/DNA-binding winged helix-turn-helix (wHTH) protein
VAYRLGGGRSIRLSYRGRSSVVTMPRLTWSHEARIRNRSLEPEACTCWHASRVIYAFGECELDVDRFELRRDGTVCKVEPQVFDVLALLVRERGRVVTKEEILDTVWGDRFVSESALTSRIKALRRAVGDTGKTQQIVRTVHGRGYQFVAETGERTDGRRSSTEPVALPQQEIRFCTTADGVRLAYATMGEGPPLVKAANWLTHLDYDRETVVWRHWLAGLSRHHRLVRYDERGCGLSDWDVPDFSLDAWVHDLETVIDAAGLDKFALLGISQGGAVAISYAVRNPERVSHLVLLGSFAQGRRKRARTSEDAELVEAYIELTRLGWGRPDPQFRHMFMSRFLPEGTQEEWQEFDELQRRSTSAGNAWRFLNEFADIDVTDIATRVSVPTLVACARREPGDVFEESRRLASLIPGSRMLPLDSCNHLLPERDPAWPHFLAEVEAFLA